MSVEPRADDGAEVRSRSKITETIVDFLEKRGVAKYGIQRTPSSLHVSLPNEPENVIQRYIKALQGSLHDTSAEQSRDVDLIFRDPRDNHVIIIELKPVNSDPDRTDAIVQVLKYAEDELRRRGIESLLLFGSAAARKPHPGDVDLLARFRPDVRLSAFDLADIQLHLEQLLDRRVDLSNEKAFPAEWRARVEQTGIRIFGS